MAMSTTTATPVEGSAIGKVFFAALPGSTDDAELALTASGLVG
jgi:hypothetical protein